MTAVLARNLNYRYNPEEALVLKDIDIQVEKGETVAITGLSGCGKSTLCLCLSGAVYSNQHGNMSGEVIINGKRVSEIRGPKLALEVGIVFQDPDMQLFSTTVEDEIAFAPENLYLSPELIKERVDAILELFKISHLRRENPSNLSGGEKQLVALASVIALDPPVLILDEVMSYLDAEGKGRVLENLQRLRALGKTIIMVEHDAEILSFANRLFIMEDGRVIRDDLSEIILTDRDYLKSKCLIDFNE